MTQSDQVKWNTLTSMFPKNVAMSLQPRAMGSVSLDEAQQDYAVGLTSLPLALSERIARPDTQETVDVDTSPSWCVCEMPEGDFPRVRVFGDFEVMLRHVGKLEKDEVSVWIFYGVPVSMTQPDVDGSRYILTSRTEAFKLPFAASEDISTIDRARVSNLSVQEDGWLGDPSLTKSAVPSYYVHEAPRDDEFDPSDDDDDRGVAEPSGI